MIEIWSAVTFDSIWKGIDSLKFFDKWLVFNNINSI